MIDVLKIAHVTPKGVLTDGAYRRFQDPCEEVCEIILECKEMERAYRRLLPVMYDHVKKMHDTMLDGLETGTCSKDFPAVCEGADSLYRVMLQQKNHVEKVLRQAEQAANFV